MRTVSTDLDTALGQSTTNFARLWTITRIDGTVTRITDHDEDIPVGGNAYVASVGFTTTAAMISATSIGSQNVELVVPLTTLGITENDLRQRLYEGATCSLEVVNYLHPEYGTMKIFSGVVGRVVLSDKHRATIEVVTSSDPNLMVANEVYSAACRNELGDSKCLFNIFSMQTNIVVTEYIDPMAFAVDTLSGQADDYFALGQIKWTSGQNTGLISDVRTNAIKLLTVGIFYPLPFPVAPGDTGELVPGCDKQLTTCFKKFANQLNFRGEPFALSFGG